MAVTQNTLAATPSMAAPGLTSMTSGAANTKGSWAQIVASTNFDVWGITIVVTLGSQSSAVRNWLMDLGVGAAASEQVIASNFSLVGPGSMSNTPPSILFFPLFIPKGTRVAIRGQCSNATTAVNVLAFFQGGPSSPPWPVFSGCEAIGVDTATSKSTAITVGSGAGTESAWTSVGSATSRGYKAIQQVVQQDVNTGMLSTILHSEWGYSSTTLGESVVNVNNVEHVSIIFPSGPDYIPVPSGTQLQVRAESTLATGETYGWSLLGYY
jgi:hypothetical protein